uniref:Uncharacterized protein LOC102804333 n=1 Tax=Saccoglossus kowalevskii TaxID=10224 RepID=A0ABM0MA13_SACKO|nr:PREDICTED: uncharacterized protein LOC102804333 [Saccoglossus kowalevskii]
MNCFLKLFITCCVFVAFFEFFVTWDSLQTVLDSVKPVARVTKAGNGTGLNSVEVTDADGDIQTTNTNEVKQQKTNIQENSQSKPGQAIKDPQKISHKANESRPVGQKKQGVVDRQLNKTFDKTDNDTTAHVGPSIIKQQTTSKQETSKSDKESIKDSQNITIKANESHSVGQKIENNKPDKKQGVADRQLNKTFNKTGNDSTAHVESFNIKQQTTSKQENSKNKPGDAIKTPKDISSKANESHSVGQKIENGKPDKQIVGNNDKHNTQSQPGSDKNNKIDAPAKKTRRYLFPLHWDYNGPNVQYGSFAKGVAFALAYGRTVVENWFGTHWTSGAKSIRFLNETFDMQTLGEIVDVALVDEFRKDCNSTVERLLMHPYYRMGSVKTKPEYLERFKFKRDGLEKRYGIKLPDSSHIPENSQQAEELLLNPPDTKCLGVLDPGIDTRWEFPALTKQYYKVHSHLRAPKYIMKMADDVAGKLCDGDPFMALHWRNRSGEACGRNNKPCGIMDRIHNITRTAEVAAKDIFKLMKDRSISCLYVAVPSFSVVSVVIA